MKLEYRVLTVLVCKSEEFMETDLYLRDIVLERQKMC